MCITLITNYNEAKNLTEAYAEMKNRFRTMSYIPVVGLLGGIGMLASDLTLVVINNLFVANEFRDAIAKKTYASYISPFRAPETIGPNELDATAERIWATISILTCGFALLVIILGTIFYNCLCSCC